MTITNNPKASGASFTLDMGQDSSTSNQVQKTALCEPVGGTFITPAQEGTDATGVVPPSGATGIRGWLSSIWNKLNNPLAVTGTFFQATQPISAISLPLATGAALDATLTGGVQKAIARGGQKGTTNTNADVTHTPSGANHEGLDVALYDASGNQLGLPASPVRTDPTGTTTQPVSASSLPLPAGAATAAGSANIATGQVSIGTSATLIAAQRTGRLGITIVNKGTVEVDIGGSGVTTANGSPLPPVQWASKTIITQAAIYGIVASGTQTVAFEELF